MKYLLIRCKPDGLGGNILYYIYGACFALDNDFTVIDKYIDIKHSSPFYNTFNILYHGENIKIDKTYKYKKYDKWISINDKKEQIIPNDQIKLFDIYDTNTFSFLFQKYRNQLIKNYKINYNSKYNLCENNKINIVIHIRRGDIHYIKENDPDRFNRMKWYRKYINDDTYIKIITKLNNILPKEKVVYHIFSEGNIKDFEIYIKLLEEYKTNFHIEPMEYRYLISKNITKDPYYNIAVENMKCLLNTMINGQIFVMSKSQLSYACGVYNQNIVITPKWTLPLKLNNWIYDTEITKDSLLSIL